VHAGDSCSDSGGHLYDTDGLTSDPWIPSVYLVPDSSTSDSEVTNNNVQTNMDVNDMVGKAFVVHDSQDAGNRASCAVLTRETYPAMAMAHRSDFGKYPGYSGSLTVSGQVAVYQVGTSQVLSYRLSGLDPACTADADITAANGCGLHIHAGACSAAGGHHFHSSVGADPWAKIQYVKSAGDVSTGTTIRVDTGLAEEYVKGRGLVVHDATGARVACIEIEGEITDLRGPSSGSPINPLVVVIALLVILALGGGGWYANSGGAYKEMEEGTEMAQGGDEEAQVAAAEEAPAEEPAEEE